MLVLHNLYMALIDEIQSETLILYKLIQVLHNTQLQFYILTVHKTKHNSWPDFQLKIHVLVRVFIHAASL